MEFKYKLDNKRIWADKTITTHLQEQMYDNRNRLAWKLLRDKHNTVNSRYLEIQRTLWNTSRYP